MNGLLANANLNIAGWELILMVFLAGVGVLLGLAFGKERIFALILGGYISFALMSVLSFKKIFPALFAKEENFVILVVVFIVLTGLSYFLLARSVFKSSIKKRGKSVFYSVVLGIFLMGMLVSMGFSFFPKDLLYAFTPLVRNIFNSSTFRLLWLVAPLIFIGIFKGNNSKN